MSEEHSKDTSWTRQLRASIASLFKPLTDYFENGTPPPTPENKLQNLPVIDIIGLILLVILLVSQIPQYP